MHGVDQAGPSKDEDCDLIGTTILSWVVDFGELCLWLVIRAVTFVLGGFH